jgi:hypothetical protein
MRRLSSSLGLAFFVNFGGTNRAYSAAQLVPSLLIYYLFFDDGGEYA